MTTEPLAGRSRRTVIGAGLGGLVALLAQAIGRPAPVDATDGSQGGALILGSNANTASHPTDITVTTSGSESYGFGVDHTHDDGYAIWGTSHSPGGTGVYGVGPTGVLGQGSSTGVAGSSINNTGVYATSGTGTALWAQTNGTAATSTAIYAVGNAGPGLYAQTAGEIAIYGVGATAVSADGTDFGVIGRGINAFSVGVKAESTLGVALQVEGAATFSRSKRVSVPAGKSSVAVKMAGVKTTSWVIATLQKSVTGVYVAAAVPTAGKVTIHLNKTVAASTPVGFLVIN